MSSITSVPGTSHQHVGSSSVGSGGGDGSDDVRSSKRWHQKFYPRDKDGMLICTEKMAVKCGCVTVSLLYQIILAAPHCTASGL